MPAHAGPRRPATARDGAVGALAGDGGPAGASTEDYLAALGPCRPTVTPAMVQEFAEDITAHAWLQPSAVAGPGE
jgi:hypothetical protein